MFKNSPNSEAIWKYFNNKYGQLIAPVGLAKACSVVSSKMSDKYGLSIFTVAPTRQFKSMTSMDAGKIFPKSYYLELGSDFTIHDIYEHYGSKGINKRCLMINDATLLFSSKGKRTKERLICGLSELLSDGKYRYGERMSEFVLKGKISVIMNMTMESYQKYESTLMGSTYLERFVTLFYSMPVEEQLNFMSEKKRRMNFHWKSVKPEKMKFEKNVDFGDFFAIFSQKAVDFACLALKSNLGTNDQLQMMAKAHACLNARDYICQDDLDFIDSLRDYFSNPFAPNEDKIVRLRKESRSYKDICLLLGKTPSQYKPYVSRVIRKARMRGLLS